MSRGGRGGRFGGGGMNKGGKMRGERLPFNIDPEIEEEAERAIAEDSGDDKMHKELFPPIEILAPQPSTEAERYEVQLYRANRAKRVAGPFWTGERGDYAARRGDPDMPGGFNPFADAPTYTNRKRKRTVVGPRLKGVKNLYSQIFPKELRDFVFAQEGGENAEGPEAKRVKRLGLARKSVKDKLAKFDDDHDDEARDEHEAEDEADERAAGEADEDAVSEPIDDSYEEDDDDAGNDYNAEGYFDTGEADLEDYGGDDFGEDGY